MRSWVTWCEAAKILHGELKRPNRRGRRRVLQQQKCRDGEALIKQIWLSLVHMTRNTRWDSIRSVWQWMKYWGDSCRQGMGGRYWTVGLEEQWSASHNTWSLWHRISHHASWRKTTELDFEVEDEVGLTFISAPAKCSLEVFCTCLVCTYGSISKRQFITEQIGMGRKVTGCTWLTEHHISFE